MILLNAGKPLRPHQKSLCQACSDGICRIGAWRSRQRLNSISFFKYYISNLASYQSYFVFLRMSVPFIFLFRPSSRLFISFISLFATDRECECHRVFGHFPFQLFVYFLFLNKKKLLIWNPCVNGERKCGRGSCVSCRSLPTNISVQQQMVPKQI